MKSKLLFESYPFIVKDNLTLTKIQASQSESLIKLINDSEYTQFSPQKPLYNDFNITDLYRQTDALYRAGQAVWLGVGKDDDFRTLDGIVILKDFDSKTDSCTIDFNFSKDTEDFERIVFTLNTVLEYMFDEIEISRIKAVCLPQNTRYSNYLKECGFILEGTSRNGDYWDGKGVVSVSTYSMLREDYFSLNQNSVQTKETP